MSVDPGDELWAAIADPSRRRVLDLLVRDGEATASTLAQKVPFTRQAVAKHLTTLESAGLVTRQKRGREALYEVNTPRLTEATTALTQVAKSWTRRLTTIKDLAESTHRSTQPDHGDPPGRRGTVQGPPG